MIGADPMVVLKAESLGFSETLDMESAAALCISLHRCTKALSVALGFRDLLTQHHSERVRGLCELPGEACAETRRRAHGAAIILERRYDKAHARATEAPSPRP